MKDCIKSHPEKWKKVCKRCGDNIYFKTYNSYTANVKKNSVCKECRHKNHSLIMSGRKRPVFTEEWRLNMSKSHKNSEVWKASMNTPEYKEKHRLKLEKMRKENKVVVCFNNDACKVFNFINSKLNWDGQHAKNGKEVIVENFFLDFYEPTLNIAIEWDEKHHKKSSHKRQDYIKQKFVMDKLNCEFYRVDDTNKIIRKIHSTRNDNSNLIQSVINEYYERKTSS